MLLWVTAILFLWASPVHSTPPTAAPTAAPTFAPIFCPDGEYCKSAEKCVWVNHRHDSINKVTCGCVLENDACFSENNCLKEKSCPQINENLGKGHSDAECPSSSDCVPCTLGLPPATSSSVGAMNNFHLNCPNEVVIDDADELACSPGYCDTGCSYRGSVGGWRPAESGECKEPEPGKASCWNQVNNEPCKSTVIVATSTKSTTPEPTTAAEPNETAPTMEPKMTLKPFDDLSEKSLETFDKICTNEVEKRAKRTDYQAPDCFEDDVCNGMACAGNAGTPHYFYQKDGLWEFCRCVGKNTTDAATYHRCVDEAASDKGETPCVVAEAGDADACYPSEDSKAIVECQDDETTVEYQASRKYADSCLSSIVQELEDEDMSSAEVAYHKTTFRNALQRLYCKCETPDVPGSLPQCATSQVSCEQDAVCRKAKDIVSKRYTPTKPPYYCEVAIDGTKTDAENSVACTENAKEASLTDVDLYVYFQVTSATCDDFKEISTVDFQDSIRQDLGEFLTTRPGADAETLENYVRDVVVWCESGSRTRRLRETGQSVALETQRHRRSTQQALTAMILFYPEAATDGSQHIEATRAAIANRSLTITHPGNPTEVLDVLVYTFTTATSANVTNTTADGSTEGEDTGLFNGSTLSSVIIGASVGGVVLLTAIGILVWNMKHNNEKKKIGVMLPGEAQDFRGSFPFPLKDMFELDRSKLVLGKTLGNGAFGVVMLGRYTSSKGEEMNVAVKQCGEDATHQMKTAFLEEARVMKPFVRTPHDNIIQMVGCCFQAEPLLLVVELMHTDLLDALRTNAPPEAAGFSVPLRLRVCVDVASALSHLAKLSFVHRDLACRNILVDKTLDRVKIADFGLSKDVVLEEYYTLASKTILPVRWMAPESLTRGTFSAHTDVWSLGILFFEVFTHGDRPYASVGNAEILDYIRDGKRLRKPMDCPTQVYLQMMYCWNATPSERPDAVDVYASLLDIYTSEYVRMGLARPIVATVNNNSVRSRGARSRGARSGNGNGSSSSSSDSESDTESSVPRMVAPNPRKVRKALTAKRSSNLTPPVSLPGVRGPVQLPEALRKKPSILAVQTGSSHKLADSDAQHDAAYTAVNPDDMRQSMSGENLYAPIEPSAQQQPTSVKKPTFVLDGVPEANKHTSNSPPAVLSTPMPRRSLEMEIHDSQYVPIDRASLAARRRTDSFYVPIEPVPSTAGGAHLEITDV